MVKHWKIVLIGTAGVGKTSLLHLLQHGSPPDPSTLDEYSSASEDVYTFTVDTGKGSGQSAREAVNIIETASLDAAKPNTKDSTLKYFVELSDAIIFVFDLTNPASWQSLESVKRDLDRYKEKRELPCLVVGNKSDLAPDRQLVDTQAVKKWVAEVKATYCETNHKQRDLFDQAIRGLVQKVVAESKSKRGR